MRWTVYKEEVLAPLPDDSQRLKFWLLPTIPQCPRAGHCVLSPLLFHHSASDLDCPRETQIQQEAVGEIWSLSSQDLIDCFEN